MSGCQESGSRTWNASVQQSGKAALGWPLAKCRGRYPEIGCAMLRAAALVRLRGDMGLHALRRAASLSEPLRRSKASSEIHAACTQPVSRMVYKWGGTDGGEGAPRCPRTSAADMGGRNGWTRPCNRARGCSQPDAGDYMNKLRNSLVLAAASALLCRRGVGAFICSAHLLWGCANDGVPVPHRTS